MGTRGLKSLGVVAWIVVEGRWAGVTGESTDCQEVCSKAVRRYDGSAATGVIPSAARNRVGLRRQKELQCSDVCRADPSLRSG